MCERERVRDSIGEFFNLFEWIVKYFFPISLSSLPSVFGYSYTYMYKGLAKKRYKSWRVPSRHKQTHTHTRIAFVHKVANKEIRDRMEAREREEIYISMRLCWKNICIHNIWICMVIVSSPNNTHIHTSAYAYAPLLSHIVVVVVVDRWKFQIDVVSRISRSQWGWPLCLPTKKTTHNSYTDKQILHISFEWLSSQQPPLLYIITSNPYLYAYTNRI